jgi:CBS domain-containing protein
MEALAIFSANKVGSLLVVDQYDDIQGILAPRDVLMAMLRQPDTFKGIRIKDIMTRNLIVGTLDDNISYIQAIMTENKVRHVPIVEGRQLKGLISIGDVVKAQMTEKEVENRYLKEYMEGKYPA